MIVINIKFDEKNRQKIIIDSCREKKKILIKSVVNEEMCLDKWIWE